MFGAEAGEGGEDVEEGEESVTGDDAGGLGEPAEGEAHQELDDCREDGDCGLGASHEVTRDDGHERALRDDASHGAAETEE